MRANKTIAFFCMGALVMLACGLTVDLGTSPSSTPTQQSAYVNQVSTTVAQTLQALTQTALLAVPANTSTPAATATALPASLSVSLATNCYAGPSTHYGMVYTIRPGTTVTVVGKDTADNYWIIDVPGYPGTVCWLSGQYASLSGGFSNLPAPATPVAPSYSMGWWTDRDDWCSRYSHHGGWSHDPHHWGDRGWRGGRRGWDC
jgi:uncharacterized protein YraI